MTEAVSTLAGELAPTGSADDEVLRLAATIDIHSPISIQEFGKEIAEHSTAYTDEILNSARAADLDETGRQLNEIVHTAQQFDLDSLENGISRTPLIGGLLKRFAMSRERAVARFETVKERVDKLVAQVDSTAQLLNRRSRDFQMMYDGVKQDHVLLGQHVQAIRLRLADLDETIRDIGSEPGDLDSAERLALLETSRNQLDKRADDLEMLRHAAMQTLPMVRIIQANNLTLVDKFQTIRQLTLPAWKRSFMLALTLDEQNRAVDLSAAIDNTTNAMMRRNAELLHQNSVATARANQRLVIDIDTLRAVHDKILLTLSDVRQEHASGAEGRKQAIAELEHLRSEMTSGINAIGLGNG